MINNINPDILNILICPVTKEKLIIENGKLLSTNTEYQILNNIPVFLNNNILQKESDLLGINNFNYVDHYQKDAAEFDYFEEHFGATKDDERRVREAIESVVPQNTNTILDIGCGNAWVAKKYCPLKINVISLDISLINVEKALKQYPYSNHFGIVADAFHLPFADNSLDCIIASEIIEHVIDPKSFVNELFRCIKQNGILIITTPYKEKLQYYLCVHCNNKTPKNAHIHSFDENKLQSLNTSKDLKTVEWFVFGNKLLLFSRSYFLLRILNFRLWRIIDKLFNLFFNKPVHILIKFMK